MFSYQVNKEKVFFLISSSNNNILTTLAKIYNAEHLGVTMSFFS